MARKKGDKSGSTQHEYVKVEMSFSGFVRDLKSLDIKELQEVTNKITYIQKLTWDQVYKTSTKNSRNKTGLNWELIDQTADDGKKIASIRVTQRHRARVCRDGVWMRFISLHPDHDSAYK